MRRSLPASRRFLRRCACSLPVLFALVGTSVGAEPQGTLRAAPIRTSLPGGGATLPVRWWCEYPLATVRLEGRGPYSFLIDTGAAVSVVDLELARAEPQRVSPARPVAQGARGEHVTALGILSLGELAVGELVLTEFDALIFDLTSVEEALRTPLDGILGYAAFADLLLELDYPERAVRVRRGRLPEADGRDVLDLLPGPIPRLPLVLAAEEFAVTLDSGSGGSLDLARWPLGAELACDPGLDLGAFTAGGIGAPRAIARLALDLRLGRHSVPRPVARLGDGEARIGARLLRHFAWTFDVSAGRVWLEAPAGEPLPEPAVRSSGLALARAERGLVVWAVLPESPAERSGVRVGDRVLALGGRAAEELSDCDDLEELLAGCEVLEARLQRGAERFELSWDVLLLVP